MVSTVSCQHCGDEHSAEVRRCLRTGDLMTDPGPCGTKIDRYLVKKLLGVGGFGAVYQAVHTRTDATVALKVLRKERADDAAAVERFMREARAAALLGSEHIARVLDAEVSAAGIPFIAMELLEGLDLSELDKAMGPVPPERLVNIMIQALSALQVAHDKGIVHRDMKPANVFVTKKLDAIGVERDFVKLLDFGISKMQATGERALTLAGTTMGTPAYMAYEQFFDARSVDGRADVYSVAAILYELLSRQRPFVANSYGELVMKVEKETPLPLKQVAPMMPEALCAVIDKGLKKDRDERWQSARELADALGKIGSLRGVVLRTEFAMAAAPVNDDTRARVATTQPRAQAAVSSRGEVKTVMMDPSLAAEAAALEATALRPAAGNDTLMMDPAQAAAEIPSSRATGNSTVMMDLSPGAVGPVPSSRSAVGNSTVMMMAVDDSQENVSTAPAMPQLQQADLPPGPVVARPQSDRPTDPSAARRDSTTQESIKHAVPGGPFGLGWPLVIALGTGAAIVLAMLVWVIMLARRGH